MLNSRQKFGKHGEDLAAAYLEEHGYVILDRNYRVAGGEIDLVASKEGVLFFVEVKARSSNQFGYPEDAVNSRKQARLQVAAREYLTRKRDSHSTWQFDVIAVTILPGKDPEIEHFENIIG